MNNMFTALQMKHQTILWSMFSFILSWCSYPAPWDVGALTLFLLPILHSHLYSCEKRGSSGMKVRDLSFYIPPCLASSMGSELRGRTH